MKDQYGFEIKHPKFKINSKKLKEAIDKKMKDPKANTECKCGHKEGSHNFQMGVNFGHCRFDGCGEFKPMTNSNKTVEQKIVKVIEKVEKYELGYEILTEKRKKDFIDDLVKLFQSELSLQKKQIRERIEKMRKDVDYKNDTVFMDAAYDQALFDVLQFIDEI